MMDQNFRCYFLIFTSERVERELKCVTFDGKTANLYIRRRSICTDSDVNNALLVLY